MIAIGHTAIGVVIGVAASEIIPDSTPLLGQILIVGLIGVASHYGMDLVPHGHYEIDQAKPTLRSVGKLTADLVMPICLLGAFLLYEHGFSHISWLVGAGVLGAQLPDIVNGLRSQDLLPHWSWLNREAAFHSSTHWHNPNNPTRATNEGGLKLSLADVWQAVVVVFAVILLLQA